MKKPDRLMGCVLIILGFSLVWPWFTGCSSPPVKQPSAYEAVGLASFYGKRFQGRKTASGERYDMHGLTAAHKSLAFGTRVHVTHLNNGRSVTVRINDRGPFVKGRVIDLSYAAAKRLGMLSQGVVKVRIWVE